jgi:hypothetical protein
MDPTRDRQPRCGARLCRDPLRRQILVPSPPRRIEATHKGPDIRYVVTSIARRDAASLYSGIYRARGQAENLIKRHKSQLASDRTSCRSPLANQMRLILHTAAYWLMRSIRDAMPGHRMGRLHGPGCG